MSEIPDLVRRDIIAEVFRRADELDWDGLTQTQRSACYNRWLEDPALGGILTRYIPVERARVWIKDVPMKHYPKARSGIGPYAALTSARFHGPELIASQVFGKQWNTVAGTLRDKPTRCLLSDNNSQVLMIWGEATNLRALVWAGIKATVDGEPTPIIVVTTRQGQRLSEAAKARNVLLGKQAGLEVRHVTLRELPRKAEG